MAVRTTPSAMPRCPQNASTVPSHTSPPRGTMASPYSVTMSDQVREGSARRCSSA